MNNEENLENFELFIIEDYLTKKKLNNTLENFLKEINKINDNYNFNNFSSSKFDQNETVLKQILNGKNKIILNNNNSTTNINIINSNSSLSNENKNSKEKEEKLKNSNENIEKDLKNSSNKLNNNNESDNEKEKINENFEEIDKMRESVQFQFFKNEIPKNENDKFNNDNNIKFDVQKENLKDNVFSSASDIDNNLIENININKEVENNLSKKSLKSDIKNNDSNNENNSYVSFVSHDSDSSFSVIEIVKNRESIKIISKEEMDMIEDSSDTRFKLIQAEKKRRNRYNDNNNDNDNIIKEYRKSISLNSNNSKNNNNENKKNTSTNSNNNNNNDYKKSISINSNNSKNLNMRNSFSNINISQLMRTSKILLKISNYKQIFGIQKRLIQEYKKNIKENENEILEIYNKKNKKLENLKKNNYKHSKSLIIANKLNNSESNLAKSVMPMAYNFFIEDNISNILSKILYLNYRQKYKLFKSISKKLNDINFTENCSKCGNKINNIIYSFKSNQNNINEQNINYNLCSKCLSEIINYVNSNLVNKYLPEYKSNNSQNKKEPSINVEYLELKDENNKIIKENGEYNLMYSHVKEEYKFNLTFKYLNCKKGDVKNLGLYKNDGSGFVRVEDFLKKKDEEINVEFKLRNLEKKYIGKYKRQIYFKEKDLESNRFTFYINIVAY